jgi:hypothetical protein
MRHATQASSSANPTISGALGSSPARRRPSGASAMPVMPISAAAR